MITDNRKYLTIYVHFSWKTPYLCVNVCSFFQCIYLCSMIVCVSACVCSLGAPLFDCSSNFTDPQTMQLLQHSQRLLGNLSTIFHCLLSEAQELTQKGVYIDAITYTNIVFSCSVTYPVFWFTLILNVTLLMLLWCCKELSMNLPVL